MAICDWNSIHGGFFNGARALVTGGAGFIGSHLTEALTDLGVRVIVLDDLSGGSEANLEPFRARAGGRLRFVKGSILDGVLVRELATGCRWVFHQAAWGSVPRSVQMPLAYHETNTTGTVNVLEAARQGGVERVIFAASSSAYGDTPTLPKVESMPPRPKSPYAATKVACEAMLRAYAGCYDLDAVSLRYFNIFGPRQNANSAYAAVIAAFAKAAIGGVAPTIHGDGEQSRDFTFVDNAIHANLLAARCANRLGGEVFNVACGQRVTVNQLAHRVLQILGCADLWPRHEAERGGDVKHSLADLTGAWKALGYEPVIDFATGLEATVAWYRSVLR